MFAGGEMGTETGKLSDASIRHLRPEKNGKRVTLSDGGGLELVANSDGFRTWYWRGAVKGGKITGVLLGSYPNMPLADARRAAASAREQARSGIDPKTVAASGTPTKIAPTGTFGTKSKRAPLILDSSSSYRCRISERQIAAPTR